MIGHMIFTALKVAGAIWIGTAGVVAIPVIRAIVSDCKKPLPPYDAATLKQLKTRSKRA